MVSSMKFSTSVIILLFICQFASAQPWVLADGENFKLNNGIINRDFLFREGSFSGLAMNLNGSEFNYLQSSCEFSFTVNDKKIDGFSAWDLAGFDSLTHENEGSGLRIHLKSRAIKGLEVLLHYVTYPDLPLIRKWLEIRNNGNIELKIERLNVEDLQSNLDFVHSVVYHNYARMKHISRFVGNWDDPLVVVHQVRQRRGIAIGNEAMGVLKRTAYHTEGSRQNIEAGLTHPGQDFPFRKWIEPGEVFIPPKTFVCLYENRDDGFEVVNEEVNRFIILHMKPRIVQLERKPVFVYNTWYPFRTFVSDTLIHSVAEAAAACGIQEIIIDDGWQLNHAGTTSDKGWGGNYGDWLVDENKFKGGLKPTFDFIKSKGMKPGLWISIASATKDARVFRQHPEWFVETPDRQPGNLHYAPQDGNFFSASFGTDWYDYIKSRLLELTGEHGLEYAKLDLAVVTSPYVNDDNISGSYATTHPYHKDHHESFYVIYERLLQLFDELHEHAPELFIDCTFETAGKFQLMDYAIAAHAEGNWLSNFEEPSPVGPLRVRQMAWWRSPVLPAASLVIGNLPMDDPDFEFGLKSLIGTLPIVLGDPRKLTADQRARIRLWSEWMRKAQDKFDYMSYRKDLEGFGEPKEGAWDGWQRINFQTHSGGIFGVFRHGAKENERRVFLKDLDRNASYVVRLAPEGREIIKHSGEKLMQEGFMVEITENYGGNIYDVERL